MKTFSSLFLTASMSLFWACGSSVDPDAPNVVVITIDTLRCDHCSCYGYARETTPRMDTLAREGFRFELAYAPIPTTGPSHSSLFTSLYPLVHGVTKNGYVLDGSFTTMAEVLERRGYRTAAVVSSFPLDSKFGYDQGFNDYKDDFSSADSSYKGRKWEGMELGDQNFDRRADGATNTAIDWLKSRAGEGPFFLWVHYFDPHWPYDPPEPYQALFPYDEDLHYQAGFDTRPYDGEVRFADHEMGRLIDFLDGMDDTRSTLFVVTSDHGEGLMQHDHKGHGLLIYEEAVRIPLIFRWKGKIPGGRVIKDTVEITDIMPTVLGMLDIPFDAKQCLGRNFAPYLLEGAAPPAPRSVFLQRRHYETDWYRGTRVNGIKFGIREGDWKFIAAEEEGTEELYNLKEDPGELKNAADQYPDVKEKLKKRLKALQRSLKAIAIKKEQTISEEDNERFKALGYIK